MEIPSELHEQKLTQKWLKERGYEVAASLNGTYNPYYSQLNKNKALGMNEGFPDLTVIIYPFMVFIEMKRQRKSLKNGKLGKSPSSISQAQIRWLEKLSQISSNICTIGLGFEDVKEFILKIENIVKYLNLVNSSHYAFENKLEWKEKLQYLSIEKEAEKKRDISFAEFLQPNEREREENRNLKN